jgi:hypothetical protein
MSPMQINGVECSVCGEEFATVGEFEEHECDGGR